MIERGMTLYECLRRAFSRVALIVQIHLQQNRTDLALKEVQSARRWAQDSLLVNLAESWVGLRMVGESLCLYGVFNIILKLTGLPGYRVERDISKHIMSLKSLRRLLQRHP